MFQPPPPPTESELKESKLELRNKTIKFFLVVAAIRVCTYRFS